MPIVFEQPNPAGYSNLAGVMGAVNQTNLDREYLLQQSGLAQQGAIANANRSAQAQEVQARLSLQAQEANAAQNATPRDAFLAQQRMAEQNQGYQQQAGLIQQRAQAQNWLASQELTTQEEMQLQRMKQAMGAVDGNDSLTPEEKANYKMQIQTKIDPLAKRKELAQQKLMEQQLQTAQQQSALQATHLKSVSNFYSENPNGYKIVKDEQGKPQGFLYYDGNTIKHAKFDKESPDKSGEHDEKAYQHDEDTYWKQYHEAAKLLTSDGPEGKKPPSHEKVAERLKEMGIERPVRKSQQTASLSRPGGTPPSENTDDAAFKSQRMDNAWTRASRAGHTEEANMIARLADLDKQYPDKNKMPDEIWKNYQMYLERVGRYFDERTAPPPLPGQNPPPSAPRTTAATPPPQEDHSLLMGSRRMGRRVLDFAGNLFTPASDTLTSGD